MALRSLDIEELGALPCEYTTFDERGMTCVEIRRFQLPSAYEPAETTLLLRLPAGFPNAAPDMFWTSPGVRLKGGSVPLAAQVIETYGGRQWQRWSRHLPPGSWRPAVDSLRTLIMIVKRELDKGK